MNDEKASDKMVTVYRFKLVEAGREISPRHMWGTVESIAALEGCAPIAETARTVHRKLLENGFFFEHAASVFLYIEDPPGLPEF